MLRLMKRLRWQDWVAMVAIVGLTVVQVWMTMLLTDRVADVIRAITYLYYQKTPSALPQEAFQIYQVAGSWDALLALLQASPKADPALVDMVKNIVDASIGAVWVQGGYMLLMATLSTLSSALVAVLASGIAASFATSLRKELNQTVSGYSLAEIGKFSAASLVTRTTNDIEQVQMTLLLMMRMVFSAPVTAIWALCKIQAISGKLTLLTALFVLFLVVGLTVITLLVLPRFRKVQMVLDRLNGILSESLNGIRVVHAYNAEDYQEKKFQKSNDELMRLNLFTGHMLGLLGPLMTIVLDGITLGIYWLGASLINEGDLDYATLSSYTMLAVQLVMAFVLLLMMFVLLPRAQVSARRINEVLETKSSIRDPENPLAPKEQGTIVFDDVSFAYPGSKGNVLSHISFTAKKGDTVAVIGSTGSGKTTLVELIDRFLDATEGKVLVDGVDVKSLSLDTLRSKIGFVPQKGVLFSGTVRSNLELGTENLSDEEMKRAGRIAGADEFVSAMEKGYDSPITQGGTNVSGGQRQRLCIARAVAIHPEIYVFDDSFSALDFKTDRMVRENLRKEEKSATKVIVAQRIGTIMDADEILVLDEGKVVGQGRHEELLRSCPTYREIALSQLSKEELGL